MASTGQASHPLTRRNLEIHTQISFQRTPTTTDIVTVWAEKIVTDKHTFVLCGADPSTSDDKNADADVGVEIEGPKPFEQNVPDCFVRAPLAAARATANTSRQRILAHEQQRPFVYRNSALERLISPGAAEPRYFGGPLLSRMGIQYGSLEGLSEKSDMARGRVEGAIDRVRQARDTSGR